MIHVRPTDQLPIDFVKSKPNRKQIKIIDPIQLQACPKYKKISSQSNRILMLNIIREVPLEAARACQGRVLGRDRWQRINSSYYRRARPTVPAH